MLKNYLVTALRSLYKHKEYSFINILGLALGMACVILILLYVQQELSYDRFHENRDRIYRLNTAMTHPHSKETVERAIGPYRLAKELKVDFPDVPHFIRFAPRGQTVEHGDKRFEEENLIFTDPDIFQVFSFPLVQGNPRTVLQEPFSVVITEGIATKYFGDADPIGQTLHFSDNDFKVTGIMGKMPGNTQFDSNMIASMNAAEQVFPRIVLENWGEGSCETFVMLPENVSRQDMQSRLDTFVKAKLQEFEGFSPRIILQPLSELYLHSRNISTFAPGGDATYVYAFTAIAIFVLIIACINFMNLATARSAGRAKEVGLRKVVGAQRKQLIGQFLGESLVLSTLSLLLAVGIVALSMPAFNQLAGKELSVDVLSSLPIFAGLIAIAIIVGLVSGSYPALFLSGFEPVTVLSGSLRRGFKGGVLRKVLVTFQFAVSIFLIVVTAVVYNQLRFAQNLNPGFDKEHVVVIPGTPTELRGKYDQFRSALLANPKIVNAAGSSRVPPGRLSSTLGTRPEGVPEEEREGMQTVWTDFDFIETMGLELAAGRSFSRQFPTDASSAFILNEAAVKRLGWTNESAIGKAFGSSEIKDWDTGQWEPRDGHVVGVLKDFYFESLHQEIVPTVYFIAPYMAWNYVIRIRPEHIPETLDYVKEQWQAFLPSTPFEYNFVDENFAELYRTEERQGQIFATFALLAIFVACLGLLGLASFTAEQRTKEVGIRKVLGASVAGIVALISREFTWLVLAAFAIAAPLAGYIMQNWLQDFAYHIELGAPLFLFAGAVALVIAWLTVSYQAIKVALTNPATTLRYE